MPAAKAEVYAEFMTVLATSARRRARLDPKNELRYLRVRAKKRNPGRRRRGLRRRRDPARAGLVLSGLFVFFSCGLLPPVVATVVAGMLAPGPTPSLASSLLRADAATVTTPRRWRRTSTPVVVAASMASTSMYAAISDCLSHTSLGCASQEHLDSAPGAAS